MNYQNPYDLYESIHAALLADKLARRLSQLKRSPDLAAIIERLDQARREHADAYLNERAHRETSLDLS